MRLAIVATPSPRPDLRPVAGSLDGDLVRARLPLEDAGFELVDIDPEVDLAEQLDVLFDRRTPDEQTSILFYVAAPVVVSRDGELFVCLDTSQPDTGDALADVAAVLADRARGPVLVLLECRFANVDDDPFRAATVVAAARKAIEPGRTGIGVLVAARPLNDADEQPSPLTRALVEALDAADPARGLTARRFYAELQESEALLGVVPCFAFAEGRGSFALVPGSGGDEELPRDEDETEDEGETDHEDETETESETDDETGDEAIDSDGDEDVDVDVEPHGEPSEPHDEVEVDTSEPDDEEEAPTRGGPAEAPQAAPLAAAKAFEPASEDEPPRSRASSVPPVELPAALSFQRPAEPLPKVILSPPAPDAGAATSRGSKPPSAPPPPSSKPPSAPPPRSSKPPSAPPPVSTPPSTPPRGSSAPARASSGTPSTPPSASVPPPRSGSIPPARSAADHVARADALIASGELEVALSELKKALVIVGTGEARERAEIYARIGDIKRRQGRAREAISSFEKVLQIVPDHREAQLVLLDLSVAEKDLRGVQVAEERLLASTADPGERFRLLLEFGTRWMNVAGEPAKARACFEKALELRPEDLVALGKLRDVHEATRSEQEALAVRREIARLTPAPRARAKQYYDLGRHHQLELRREDAALELFELALDSDPTMLAPLEIVAELLAERQEWSELEAAYRRMLDRCARMPEGAVRREVTWELCRRLGLLFRDHLEDPHLALDAFEDSLEEKPEDLGGHLVAADLAKSIGELERAIVHLQAAAMLDPTRLATFHDLFELFQRKGRPDQAYSAAAVTTHLRNADTRERFVFEEHAPAGVPKLQRPLPKEAWEWLRPEDGDHDVDAILGIVARAAIAAKLDRLEAEGRLPALDPATRQDVAQSTVSITRSFVWASHFLGIEPPAFYVRDDAAIGVAAVLAKEPSVLAGAAALRGRSLPELAFLVGRQLAYFAGAHRLLLYFPSIEELSACFLAAVTIARPALPLPAALHDAVEQLRASIARRLGAADREALAAAVDAFEASGARADLAAWAGVVERTATRAAFALAGDLGVAERLLREDALGVLTADQKIADLLGFAVSDAHHAVREAFGVAVQP